MQPVQYVQEPDNGVEADMDWEVAPDVDRPWRRMIAQSKTAEYRRLLEVKQMVSGMVISMVDSIESVSVVNNILEAVIDTSYVEGMTMCVWRKLDCNAELKVRIKKKLMEEEEEERFLLEAQGRAERRMRQEVARRKWLSSQEEKELNDLAASLTNLTVAAHEPEKEYNLDEDGDTEMKLEESEAEIDAWLSQLAVDVEEQITNNSGNMEDKIMEMEDDNYGDNKMDDNDTIENTPENLESSYEEWVVKELDSFTVGAVTNLEVGLVDCKNYENGTWFVNRWISPPADQPQNTTHTQKFQPQNFEDKTCYVDRIMCQHNNKNNIEIVSSLSSITSGSTHHCNLARPRKRRRTRRSSTRWSSGSWSSTGRVARSCITPGSSGSNYRIVRTGRRRINSSVTLPAPARISLTTNTIHTIISDHNQSGQGGGGEAADAHGDQGEHRDRARAVCDQRDQTLPASTSTSITASNTHTIDMDHNHQHQGGQDGGEAAEGQGDQGGQGDGAQAGEDRRDQPQHSVEGAQGDGGQPSIGRSRPRRDFSIVKKRGIIPDGLVQRRLDSFVIAFPNLRREGGTALDGADRGVGVGIKRKNGT